MVYLRALASLQRWGRTAVTAGPRVLVEATATQIKGSAAQAQRCCTHTFTSSVMGRKAYLPAERCSFAVCLTNAALPLPLPSPPRLCSQVFMGIGGPSLLEGRGLQEWQRCIPDILNETYDGGDVRIDIFEQVR